VVQYEGGVDFLRAVGTVVYAIPPRGRGGRPQFGHINLISKVSSTSVDIAQRPLGPYGLGAYAPDSPMIVLRDGEGRLLHFPLPPAGGGGSPGFTVKPGDRVYVRGDVEFRHPFVMVDVEVLLHHPR
jgi:hypothetical protein